MKEKFIVLYNPENDYLEDSSGQCVLAMFKDSTYTLTPLHEALDAVTADYQDQLIDKSKRVDHLKAEYAELQKQLEDKDKQIGWFSGRVSVLQEELEKALTEQDQSSVVLDLIQAGTSPDDIIKMKAAGLL